MLKVIIGLLLVGVVISLFSGLVFLIKDDNDSKRVVRSLIVRVTLAALIVIVVLFALWTGELKLNPSPI